MNTYKSIPKRRLIASPAMIAATLSIIAFILSIQNTFAGSALWGQNPGSGNWNTATNWTPNTVPNGPADVATFDLSSVTSVSLSVNTQVNRIVFNSGASSYAITVAPALSLIISGAGIINNSGAVQSFITSGSAINGQGGGQTQFRGTSTAGNAAITNNPGTVSGAFGGFTSFSNSSSAGNATITNNAAAVNGSAIAGATLFNDTSTAGSATIINNGVSVSGAARGVTNFFTTSSAGSATIIANGGSNGGTGGGILFLEDSTGGTSQVEVFDNGSLDISGHNAPGITIGSLEGNGDVFLGANNLTVGSRNTNTIFSGVIQDDGFRGGTGGSLTKIGTGTLTLSRACSYTGPTIINGGKLILNSRIMSNVTVNAGGELGGSGRINGNLINGSDTTGPGGVVHPGDPQTLTINGNYTQGNGGTLELSIAGTGNFSFDRLAVNGGVTLAANALLRLDFINGFAPHSGDTFDLLSFSSLTGNFSDVAIEGLQPGFQYSLAPDGNGNLQLTALNNAQAIPEPSIWAMLGIGGVALLGLIVWQRSTA